MKTPIRTPPALKTPPQLTPAENVLVEDLVRDGLSIHDKFRPEPLYRKTGKGHYASDTVEEIRRAKKSNPKRGKS
jgi:hypothetical protein